MNAALFPDLVVNGEHVPHAMVAAETQNQTAPEGKPGIAWRKAANAVAIRILLLQEARSRAIAVDQQEVGPGRFETEEEALIRGLLEQAILASPPDDADVRAEWAKDPSRFRTPPLWEVSHILCACDPRDEEARDKALVRAKTILSAALDDPKSFAWLATKESDCGSKGAGGALGQLGPNDTVPEFEAELRQLAEGQISPEPVLTRHGYHILRMDAVAPGQILPFEAVRDKIAEAMEKAAWARQSRQFVSDLVAASEIEGADFKMV
ncbi:peptidylprolyl isomerase [Antarctobacter heliothermus]|uniref:Parvulin-like PPIase n=1 Tax=Antarctobacter heliothermus TaxID=74033 RepID=A0A239I151_9RHOB|nr:peptidylprolyl isomerase [Antarctobacter heliothermus]SNS87370.1 peptidyl-prolyl cis-trans isomerase C [Antarctobacter heliothermus]